MIEDLPLFPLNAVLFPGGRLPLRIFEQRYLGMVKVCLREEAPFGICLIREGKEVGAAATPEDVGCLARLASWDMPQLGVLQVEARGEQRFRILERRVQADGLARARVQTIGADTDAVVPDSYRACVSLLEQLIERHACLFDKPYRLDSASWVSARLAEILPVSLAAKQKMLELDDGLVRLEILHRFLAQHRPARGR